MASANGKAHDAVVHDPASALARRFRSPLSVSLIVLAALAVLAVAAFFGFRPVTGGGKNSVHVSGVAVGYLHACALLPGGTVKCWGFNGAGQLGHGVLNHGHQNKRMVEDLAIEEGFGASGDFSPNPVWVSGIRDATQISAALLETCALIRGGTVKCWGDNVVGQLGDGVVDHGHKYANGGGDFSPTPVLVSGITNATQISTSGSHACALLTGGRVKCWGASLYGDLGDGRASHGHYDSIAPLGDFSPVPVQVSGITDAVAVSAGVGYSCAVRKGGTVWCWGGAWDGVLGNGSTRGKNLTPVQVSGIRGAVAVNASDVRSCALLNSGTVKCWGDNSFGELGDGKTDHGRKADCSSWLQECSPTPVQVSGITDATQISAGRGDPCAVLSDGHVWCWGDNSKGQLGDGLAAHGHRSGFSNAFSPTPVRVSGITQATAVSTGERNSCALLSDGGVECWGENAYGQLGNGSAWRHVKGRVTPPVKVKGLGS